VVNRVALAVPVLHNFEGFTELMHSVDIDVRPFVIPNWRDNRGVSWAWNDGMRRAAIEKYDAVFILNDDVVFHPGTMKKMLLGLAEGHDLVTGFNTRDENYDHFDRVEYIESPDYACFVVNPISFISKFGWFDENFFPAYFEDNDMNYRIKLAGGTDRKRTDAPFFHKGSVTQNWGGSQIVTSPMFEKNREYYMWKWGGVPGHETLTTPNTRPQDVETGVGIE
jgi:GT2 family glycosyltransferase